MLTATLDYPFTEQEMNAAAEEWGCNCGPSALSFALQKPLEAVRYAIPDFEKKGYASPTMMAAALTHFQQPYERITLTERPSDLIPLCHERPTLVRVQWTGPWTQPGVNPKWCYRMTHWITVWRQRVAHLVFDCNGGAMLVSDWDKDIAPMLAKSHPRADGKWFFTHAWRLAGAQ